MGTATKRKRRHTTDMEDLTEEVILLVSPTLISMTDIQNHILLKIMGFTLQGREVRGMKRPVFQAYIFLFTISTNSSPFIFLVL